MRPGYKQTEVGVIPEEWEVRSLGALTVQITDGDHATPRREDNGYFLLSARNIRDGRIELTDVDYVGESEYRRMRLRCAPAAGDILISCSGSIGRVSVVPEGLECVLVRSAALAKIDDACASGTFIQYWLQGRRAQLQIANSVNQGAQPNLFLNQIERILCVAPPLPEQRAIAEALSDADALLAALDRLIAKKRDLKQAAMQQLLTGRTRLPGFSGEWEMKRLGDMGSFLKGSGVRKDEARSGDLPCVRYGEIYTHHSDHIRQYFSSISEEVARHSTLLAQGDLLFAGSGETKEEIGKCVAVVDAGIAYAGSDIVILRNHRGDPRFLGYYCNAPEVARQKASRAQGDAVVHIGASALASIRLRLPPVAEQRAIAAVLSDMDAELEALEARREKTRALKGAMMQELLTGRTRLV